MTKTFSAGITDMSKKKVPKLDFSVLKQNKEFKDWYAYSKMLERSIKALRVKIKNHELDLASCTEKNLALRKQNANLYGLNKKLVHNTKMLKKKIVEIKERYNKRVTKAKRFGVNALEMTIPRFETEITYNYGGDGFDKEGYIDDFNSQDSYDQDKFKNEYRAYKDSSGMKMTITEEDLANSPNKKYILEQNENSEIDDLADDKFLDSKIYTA